MTSLRKNSILSTLLAALILLALAGCGGGSTEMRDYLNDPNYPQDFWTTGTPEEVGMNSQTLIDCSNMSGGIHSILVIRNDKLVFERYGTDTINGRRQLTPDDAVVMHSVTKSFTSALIGIALNEGSIHSLQDRALSYFSDTSFNNMSSYKQEMTIEDLITMRSGIVWSENNAYWGGLASAHEAGVFALNQPMYCEPGTVFDYNTGNSAILASIIFRSTGKTPENYAREKLFGPLGITNFHWTADQRGINLGGSELYIRPRDMAKFGYLYLKHGVWNGSQVIPSSWVEASTQQQVATGSYYTGYGYHWWRYPHNGFMALGRFGQYIIVFPDLNLILVFTSYLDNYSTPIDNIVQNILQSVN